MHFYMSKKKNKPSQSKLPKNKPVRKAKPAKSLPKTEQSMPIAAPPVVGCCKGELSEIESELKSVWEKIHTFFSNLLK